MAANVADANPNAEADSGASGIASGIPSGIEVLGTAQHAAWQRRTLPPVERITGGLWSIPVPIPDNPLRYTLSYVIPGDNGVVVVDPGWDTEECWQVLRDGLAEAGVAVGDVIGIVATHVHPDHHGLSGRLRDASGAWVAMHPAERDSLPHRAMRAAKSAGSTRSSHRGPLDRLTRMLRAGGAPAEEVTALLRRFDHPEARRVAEMADPDVLLDDGDQVPLPGRQVRAIWTPGHTPGHLCLRDVTARVLLTGDHVLPRISPNIGMQPGAKDAPLHRYLDSLARVAEFDDHDVLPAHEYRFRGLAARTRQLREHHDQRCAELLGVVADLGTPTLWQLAENLTWSRSWAEIGPMRLAALAETAAHANHLVEAGRLAWAAGETDADGHPLVRLRPVA